MSEATIAKPRKILLATDMSCRCDRALDRAVQLAGEFDAELVAAYIAIPANDPRHHVDRVRRPSRKMVDPTERMRWRLKRDLASAADNIRAIVEEGDAAEKLLEIAAREGCDLIVTGYAREESLMRMLLGSTVNRLVRGSSMPVLMVHDRVLRPYTNIVVATDFSEASIQALLTASAFFPNGELTLFHAYDIPFAGFVISPDFTRELRSIEKKMSAKFLKDERISPSLRENAAVVIEHGSPEVLLSDYVEGHDVDLTVIGSHGRGAMFDALIGSNAKRMVETLEGDLLIIRHIAKDE